MNFAKPTLLSFAAQVFEKHGGMAEQDDNHVMALLPPGLAHSLDLPEEVQLGGGAMPLLYGSPVLDRLIRVATEEIPLVFGRIEVPYLKKAGFEQLIGQDIVFTNGQARVTSRAEARASYMVLTCRYVALSDERKEGLVGIRCLAVSILWYANVAIRRHEACIPLKKIPGFGCSVIPLMRMESVIHV